MSDLQWPTLPLGLAPRRPGPRCDRVSAQLLLESERTVAAGLAMRAIAEAWDTGRIAVAPDPAELPHEREVLGLLGVSQDLAPARVAEASESLTEVLTAARDLEARTVGLHPIAELIEEFALSPLARMVLMLVAAPQMWGEIAQLYAIVANNPTRAIVDEHLLRQLLGPRVNPHELGFELGPTQPLRRFGLIHASTTEPRPFTGLVPDSLVLARLRGEPLDEDPAGELALVQRTKPIDALRIPPAIAATIAATIARAPSHPLRIVVRGREGSGRRTLLAALARLAHRRLAIVHLDHLGDQIHPSPAVLRRALERCALAGWIPCIDGIDTISADDRVLREKLRHVIDAFPGPLGVRVDRDGKPPISAGYLQVDLPDLTETERLELWRVELAEHGLTATADELAPVAARWRIGPGTIHRVVAHTSEGELSTAHIDQAVSQHLERRLGDVAEKMTYLPRLEDMVLPADILDSLKEFLSRMRLHRKVFEEWGMGGVATTGRGIAALFQGPPGTGKTMVAGALARELGIELYRVDLSRVMSKWIGETERNLGNVFAAAEEGQSIILFDEADSLFGKRTEVKSSNDRFANLEVNYLLQRLDSFLGVAILTTNMGTAIDDAFKRRLAFRIHFPIPDEDQREQLWRTHLPKSLPTTDDLDLEDLAHRYPLTGGSVRNCVMRAAFLAAAENQTLSQEHLMRAVRLEYRAAGKLSESGPLE